MVWSCFFFFFGGLGHERYVTHWEGRGAGLVVDCPGAMPFVRGIVGGVVYRDAAGRRRITRWRGNAGVAARLPRSGDLPHIPPHTPPLLSYPVYY